MDVACPIQSKRDCPSVCSVRIREDSSGRKSIIIRAKRQTIDSRRRPAKGQGMIGVNVQVSVC